MTMCDGVKKFIRPTGTLPTALLLSRIGSTATGSMSSRAWSSAATSLLEWRQLSASAPACQRIRAPRDRAAACDSLKVSAVAAIAQDIVADVGVAILARGFRRTAVNPALAENPGTDAVAHLEKDEVDRLRHKFGGQFAKRLVQKLLSM
jgi:hypothetical protein